MSSSTIRTPGLKEKFMPPGSFNALGKMQPSTSYTAIRQLNSRCYKKFETALKYVGTGPDRCQTPFVSVRFWSWGGVVFGPDNPMKTLVNLKTSCPLIWCIMGPRFCSYLPHCLYVNHRHVQRDGKLGIGHRINWHWSFTLYEREDALCTFDGSRAFRSCKICNPIWWWLCNHKFNQFKCWWVCGWGLLNLEQRTDIKILLDNSTKKYRWSNLSTET